MCVYNINKNINKHEVKKRERIEVEKNLKNLNLKSKKNSKKQEIS